MSSKAKRPTPLDKLVSMRAMMLVNQTWQKKVDELEARLRTLEITSVRKDETPI